MDLCVCEFLSSIVFFSPCVDITSTLDLLWKVNIPWVPLPWHSPTDKISSRKYADKPVNQSVKPLPMLQQIIRSLLWKSSCYRVLSVPVTGNRPLQHTRSRWPWGAPLRSCASASSHFDFKPWSSGPTPICEMPVTSYRWQFYSSGRCDQQDSGES